MNNAAIVCKKVPRDIHSKKPRLPATIVMIHGWSFNARSMQPLEGLLSQWADVWLLDLKYQQQTVESLVDAIVNVLPERSILLGWSLGAMLAVKIASQKKQSIVGVISLSANAKFVQGEAWPMAMPAATFNRFVTGLKKNPARQLEKFNQLVAYGDEASQKQLDWLQNKKAEEDDLHNGLVLLNTINNIDLFKTLDVPSLSLFGENDALVPSEAAESLSDHCQVEVLKNRGHCLHYPAGEAQQLLEYFLERFSCDR